MTASRSAPPDEHARRDPETSAPRCAECGAVIARARTGRPRLYCGDACRRQGDHRQRKIRWRAEAVAGWVALLGQPGRGGYPRAFIRQVVRELRSELYVLQRGESV